ncbi:hypothetical protein M2451_003889 [Dysgonomonas sp. PFB1-18]|uniref:type IV secretion system protein n=1 Tax=unclassified Dysgonomonas TaxID=2630389 RepID=UPI00247402E6|nr:MULTISPECIES: type IV secretion system protein [unclassified Dysgonomonas]MDH6311067.1 hypothetical protein [Dysgonomonas sp. PF1-14]MDH6340993.1 hypothetical protein [Dysgonomonas sp. PF1-16]MDH6382548.1 hypothetical protein [Dysgonomonas sp. PFB1-18]MDH6399918.1 hypothetical protein [Dysgonomonas sp. PF1-23]
MNESSIKQAYYTIHSNGAVQGCIGIVVAIALTIMIFRLVKIYDISKVDNKQGNRKIMFDLLIQYGKYMVFICAFPFLLGGIESVLADVQQGVSSKFNASVNVAGTTYAAQMIDKYVNDKQAKKLKQYEDKSIIGKAVEAVTPDLDILEKIDMMIATSISLAGIYILKYIYFFFCAGRYLWLLMLEIVAPIAVICAMSEKTFDVFKTWLKNMAVCYLLIPFYLMADVFAESIIKVMFEGADMSAYGILGICGMITIKIALFGVVTKRTLQLL